MYRRCTTQKTTNQQRHLEKTLLEMLQLQPFSDITVSALCEKAGLSRNIFYRLFDSKQDVLYALIDGAIADYVRFQPVGAPAAWAPGSAVEAFFRHWKAQKPLLDALEKNKLSILILERSMLYVFQEDSATLRVFQGKEPENVTEVLLYHLSGLMTLVLSWYYSGYGKTPEEMAKIAQYILENPPARMEKV